jgi:putative hemolysin
MKKILPIILVFSILFLTSCKPQTGIIPTPEQVAAKRANPSDQELLDYCHSKGGHYEDWDNHDNTSTTYCILASGYGCDPEDFFQGSCGVEWN